MNNQLQHATETKIGLLEYPITPRLEQARRAYDAAIYRLVRAAKGDEEATRAVALAHAEYIKAATEVYAARTEALLEANDVPLAERAWTNLRRDEDTEFDGCSGDTEANQRRRM